MAFASQQTVDILASEEELAELDKAFESNEKNKLSKERKTCWFIESDEDKKIILKQMLIDMRKRVFDVWMKLLSKVGHPWSRACSLRVWKED